MENGHRFGQQFALSHSYPIFIPGFKFYSSANVHTWNKIKCCDCQQVVQSKFSCVNARVYINIGMLL